VNLPQGTAAVPLGTGQSRAGFGLKNALMTPKEALARIEDGELSPKEIEWLLAFAEDICARVLGPDWRIWPRKETKLAD